MSGAVFVGGTSTANGQCFQVFNVKASQGEPLLARPYTAEGWGLLLSRHWANDCLHLHLERHLAGTRGTLTRVSGRFGKTTERRMRAAWFASVTMGIACFAFLTVAHGCGTTRATADAGLEDAGPRLPNCLAPDVDAAASRYVELCVAAVRARAGSTGRWRVGGRPWLPVPDVGARVVAGPRGHQGRRRSAGCLRGPEGGGAAAPGGPDRVPADRSLAGGEPAAGGDRRGRLQITDGPGDQAATEAPEEVMEVIPYAVVGLEVAMVAVEAGMLAAIVRVNRRAADDRREIRDLLAVETTTPSCPSPCRIRPPPTTRCGRRC